MGLDDKKLHFLIVGCGSVGKRHARNLNALGCQISCFDPSEDRAKELLKEMNVHSWHIDFEECYKNEYDGVVICSPTAYHAEQTVKSIKFNLPVLLEKPPAKTLTETSKMLEAISQSNASVLLGYTWRWWQPLRRAKALIDEGEIGKLLHVQFHMSAHLADWHPWEAYQSFFMASAEQGGGALLDESHWIDLMLWFFGKPESVFAQVEKNSVLEISSDDNVDAIINYNNGLRITLHLDLYGRPHEKFIRFIGEDGTLIWSVDPNEIKIGKNFQQEWSVEKFYCERNDMFIDVAKEFLDVVKLKKIPTCNLLDGIAVMEIIEAIRKSSKEKKLVVL